MSGKVCVNINGEDLYKILGVNSNATPKQIKCAYYELSKLHHPDLNCDKDSASSTHRFQRINYAYEILESSDKFTSKDIYKMDERTLRDFNEFRRKFVNQFRTTRK
ncbi:Chaperone protein DnaJ [Trichinella spiralis]|uniref:Chaperone protein DnaJ n=1 Tax=Trichinella spiralis TaxID=6334 RepID=A0ABR3KG84_TRISP